MRKIEKWLDNNFESSSCETAEFRSFARSFKNEIKKETEEKFEIVNWNKGHFYISGFLKNRETQKMVYFSISDVRFFKNEWHDHILIRTAEHERDYTGGSNDYCDFDGLLSKAIELTK